jgi:hypothetical protein
MALLRDDCAAGWIVPVAGQFEEIDRPVNLWLSLRDPTAAEANAAAARSGRVGVGSNPPGRRSRNVSQVEELTQKGMDRRTISTRRVISALVGPFAA